MWSRQRVLSCIDTGARFAVHLLWTRNKTKVFRIFWHFNPHIVPIADIIVSHLDDDVRFVLVIDF